MKTVEYITCPGGDWEVLQVDGELYYEGHTIPAETWLKLLEGLYRKRVEVVRREVSDIDMEYGIYD